MFLRLLLLFFCHVCCADQWQVNRSLLDSLDSLQLDPRLYLYSAIDSELIKQYEKEQQQLAANIDLNERTQCAANGPMMLQDLVLQNLELQIAHLFQSSLLCRKKHQFQQALSHIERAFVVIERYQCESRKAALPGFRSPKDFLTLAHYHKGKIHRLLAGYDPDHLDSGELLASERSYLEANKMKPDTPSILSSLGYLYIDMGRISEAIHKLEEAHVLHPTCPEFIHGIANCYFQQEKQKSDQNVSDENLDKAQEAYCRAIKLFSQFHAENARVFLDQGMFLQFRNRKKEALDSFNKGLQLEPDHPLILLERGLLFAALGDYEAAVADLKHGQIISGINEKLHKKYEQTVAALAKPRPKPIQNADFEKVLEAFKSYGEKKGKKPTVFISYAWNIREHEEWVEIFAQDLEKAGFHVLLDRWFTRKGETTFSFIEKICADETDFIIVVGTKLLLEKYKFQAKDFDVRERWIKTELQLLNYLVTFNQQHSDKVIPIVIEATAQESLPPLLCTKNVADFVKYDYYEQMYELIRDLHRIDARDPAFREFKK